MYHSVSIVLRTSGIAPVITVEDSRAVMPLLAEQEVGVLVLDLTMPHLSGHVLLEQVTREYPDVPILLMTATKDLETAVQCMQIGASDYLVKPVEESRLVASVKRALETYPALPQWLDPLKGLGAIPQFPGSHPARAILAVDSPLPCGGDAKQSQQDRRDS